MLALGIGGYGGYFLYMRNNLIDVMTEDYILTARAKGLDENQVLYKHGLKNAMLPMVTFAGVSMTISVGASVSIETVFSYPGLGRLLFYSVLNRDYTMLQGSFFILSLIVILGTIVVDIIYLFLDPRIKY